MLVMSRKKNESIVINDDVVITIVEIRGDKVRLGITAPREVSVHRQEVFDAIHGRPDAPAYAEFAPLPSSDEAIAHAQVQSRIDRGGEVRFNAEGGFKVD